MPDNGDRDLAPGNQAIGQACRSADTACCKQGKIFLPDAQHAALTGWLAAGPAEDAAEFAERCEPHDGFTLYDQRDRCQFLDGDARCVLYGTGVRPAECLWWPLHVYAGAGGELEVRSATWCCAAAAATAGGDHADVVAAGAADAGHDVIRAFRRVYPGRPGPAVRTLR